MHFIRLKINAGITASRRAAGFALCVVVLVPMGGWSAEIPEDAEGPFVIHQIVGHPSDPKEVFAVTSNFGILKSVDAGHSWRFANRGIKSFTHHALAVSADQSIRLYVGGWGGGVSKSSDAGESWIEINDGLGNTAVDALVVDRDGSGADRLYAATSTEIYRWDARGRWTPYGEGLPPFSEEIKFRSLLLVPGPPKVLWYGNSQGLFSRSLDAAEWHTEEAFRGVRVSALAYHPEGNYIWVGTLGGGLYVRGKKEKTWKKTAIDSGLWFNGIALDPRDPNRIFVATRGRGIFASADGGKSWRPINEGIDDRDIRSLAIHPANPSLLFAGTTAKGIFRSVDGGKRWEPSKPIPSLTMHQIIGMLSGDPPKKRPVRPEGSVSMPPSFVKCNGCHGWTDPMLNQKRTYWRVPPNRRDWRKTVVRMAQRARLTNGEIDSITAFLTSFSAKRSGEEIEIETKE